MHLLPTVRSALTLLKLSILAVLFSFPANAAEPDAMRHRRPIVPDEVQTSSSSSLSAKAGADSFYIYGGPNNVHSFVDPAWDGKLRQEGQFQTAAGVPDWQGWTGSDLTQPDAFWRASTTNATLVGDGTPGNHAVISHHDGSDYQGYGNFWDDRLTFTYDIAALNLDPTQDFVDVRWTCRYSHYTESWYDFLHFEVGTSSGWSTLLQLDGASTDSTGTFVALDFDSDELGGISFSPADYLNGQLQLRFRVNSDPSYSDEDGLFSTGGLGAAAVDMIQVWVNNTLVSTASWEPLSGIPSDQPDGVIAGHDNGAGAGTTGWQPSSGPGAGDFAKLIVGFQDLDPCRSNISGQLGFVDDGTPPSNAPGVSTGGSVSSTWSYGVPGGWVLNYTKGISGGSRDLTNYIVSPEIPWDLPGAEDDNAVGLVLHTTLWEHLPFGGGYAMFWKWELRSHTTQAGWGNWKSRGFGYSGDTKIYQQITEDVSDLVEPGLDKVQVRLGVEDWDLLLQWFGFPPISNATPAPIFDNVRLVKYDMSGPQIAIKATTIADGFPVTGAPAGPVRFDPVNDEGLDAIAAVIQALIPGTALLDPANGGRLRVAHLANPVFAAERAAGLAEVGAVQVGSDDRAWPIYEYEVPGAVDPGDPQTFFFDLPDGPARSDVAEDTDETALIFSGDRLHFYLQAQDTQGGISTYPVDLSGFLDFDDLSPYDFVWSMHGLPSWDGTGIPSLLIWDMTRFTDEETGYVRAMAELGFVEGRDYDLCTRNFYQLPDLLQIQDYDTILYISPGQDFFPASSELTLLSDWHHQLRDRFHVYMGEHLLDLISGVGTVGPPFLSQILGVDVIGTDVSSQIEGQRNPMVTPASGVSGSFASSFITYGACPDLRNTDWIDSANLGAEAAHLFSDDDGIPYQPPVAASILWSRTENEFQKTTMAFPFDLTAVRGDIEGGPTSISARAQLLGEILALSGRPPGQSRTGNDAIPQRFSVLPNHPNPFNPRTSIAYHAPSTGKLTMRIFDVRGAAVRSVERIVEPGWGELIWNGRDDHGGPVASGVYYYQITGWGKGTNGKMALLK